MINFSCKKCGRSLRAPDGATGKRARCPKCSAEMKVPEKLHSAAELLAPSEEAESNQAEDLDLTDWPSEVLPGYVRKTRDAQEQEKEHDAQRIPCPVCREPIMRSATKCRHCGEIIDRVLYHRASDAPLSSRVPSYEDSELTGVDILFCIFCPLFALLIGFFISVAEELAE
jgi:DNA-directed RNA polymerase subunit M/transcription elongation factor TFIIS